MQPYLITAKLMWPSNMKRFPTPALDHAAKCCRICQKSNKPWLQPGKSSNQYQKIELSVMHFRCNLTENVILLNCKSHNSHMKWLAQLSATQNWAKWFPRTLLSLGTLPPLALKIATVCFSKTLVIYLPHVYMVSQTRRKTPKTSLLWDFSCEIEIVWMNFYIR
jgi:hypothetical protein